MRTEKYISRRSASVKGNYLIARYIYHISHFLRFSHNILKFHFSLKNSQIFDPHFAPVTPRIR